MFLLAVFLLVLQQSRTQIAGIRVALGGAVSAVLLKAGLKQPAAAPL